MLGKRAKEDKTAKAYDVDDLYGLYKLMKRFPGQEFNQKTVEKMIKAKDTAANIKALKPEELLKLYEIVKSKTNIFNNLMKDYERTKKDNSSLHKTITKTLIETFIQTDSKKKAKDKKPAKEKQKPATTPDKPITEVTMPTPQQARNLVKENKASSLIKSFSMGKPVYDFKLVLQKRFENIDLNLLSTEPNKPKLSQLFAQTDKELTEKMDADKSENHDFIERMKMITNKSIPEDMLRSPLLNEKSTELILQEIKYRLTLLKDKYKKTNEEISKIYFEVSGDLDLVEKLCQGIEVSKWSELEDLALRAGQSSKEYQFLLTTKGKEEIKKRKKFLMI